jgi:hypothetical protein
MIYYRPTPSMAAVLWPRQLSNITKTRFEMDHGISSLTVGAGRADDRYLIPNSDMILRVIRDSDSPMIANHIVTCLTNAKVIARAKVQIEAAPEVWWYDEPRGGARFGVASTIYAPDLTWQDVVYILAGLLSYYDKTQAWEEAMFFVSSERRGAFASGALKYAKRNPGASRAGDTASS